MTALALSALGVAACGGGGGGGSNIPIGPGPKSTATPTPTPTPNANPGAQGTMSVNGSALTTAKVAFSCGCNTTGGSATTDGSGDYSIVQNAPVIPGAGTYTIVPGRNYMIVGAGGPNQTEAWTMMFLGNVPAHNLYLGLSGANMTDAYTAAAALYVFYSSASLQDPLAYDHWNFNTILSFEHSLRASGGNNAAEKQLLADIASAQASGLTLFPEVPQWDPDSNGPNFQTNTTINNDLAAVAASNDQALPTPCPSTGCTGAPSP